MVHTGKPSRGCAVCRKRRIKCDEKSPSCSYCLKTKQQCPGYKNMFDLAWRDQTVVAQKSVERRRRATEKTRAEKDATASTSGVYANSLETTVAVASKIATTIPAPLDDSPENYALGFFFITYANPPSYSDDRYSFLEYVAPQFLTTSQDSTLKMATMTVASSLFMAWMNKRADNSTSRSFYLKAVSKMKDQIEDRMYCADDDMLTSVLLLQLYEKLMSGTSGVPLTGTHLEGALALIRHRGVENFRDDVSLGLLFQVRSQLIDDSFRTSKPVQPDVALWGISTPRAQSSTPLSRLDDAKILLANLSAHVQDNLPASSSTGNRIMEPWDTTDIYDSFNQACFIEAQFQAWSSSLDDAWLPIRVTEESCIHPSIAQAGLYQSHCYVYTNTTRAYTRIKQLLSSIQVLGIQHRLLYLLADSQQPAASQQIQLPSTSDIEFKIQYLADELLASIPFLLGSKTQPQTIGNTNIQYPLLPGRDVPEAHYRMAAAFGGFWLLGPLKELLGLGFDGGWELREGQKAWMGGQMRRIARVYNLGR